ncbi:two component transcriptional regulator, LytTR family [Schinkia azotoformans MEV2011]|uniref:Two component transcriptional regulator, LytTR family n=1 Tax=Schinkia azotoformans MEV2011 TaxID=1348973 RepID=A0A072NH26_SCHAZ|nr:LytTR family DNA-binding domain-containing protein [Schinkia azotoformans]KEF37004.1 two component transcriptional regulator, LytTR family [Schinkia azotoformans MEV2011]MEC1694399.1 LytTR family DNA-binding domain-containing protein [Schinkia azotoformans]MEC1714438.1 LytTR family DNA-binding domain-containing protein [Schinkia azotoformans]MEC1723210.1 LytTR family DNA-binding domain-containing protein [Schinkia azotoformans]MEC1740467.1 LytTR family DNA-binding domain-containing protein 
MGSKIKTLVVDDELYSRDELTHLLETYPSIQIIGEADSGEAAILKALQLQPDVVFLDVEMPKINGMNAAKALMELKKPPLIVFATAYPEFAVEAFRCSAIDYLLKPFDEKQLAEAVKRIEKHFDTTEEILNPDKIALIVDEKILLVKNANIVYLESSEGKCTVVTLDNPYKVSNTLIGLEKRLDTKKFLRVHRSYIVNIDHIIEIEPWFNSTYNLLMRGGSKIPVSRTYVKDVRQLFQF